MEPVRQFLEMIAAAESAEGVIGPAAQRMHLRGVENLSPPEHLLWRARVPFRRGTPPQQGVLSVAKNAPLLVLAEAHGEDELLLLSPEPLPEQGEEPVFCWGRRALGESFFLSLQAFRERSFWAKVSPPLEVLFKLRHPLTTPLVLQGRHERLTTEERETFCQALSGELGVKAAPQEREEILLGAVVEEGLVRGRSTLVLYEDRPPSVPKHLQAGRLLRWDRLATDPLAILPRLAREMPELLRHRDKLEKERFEAIRKRELAEELLHQLKTAGPANQMDLFAPEGVPPDDPDLWRQVLPELVPSRLRQSTNASRREMLGRARTRFETMIGMTLAQRRTLAGDIRRAAARLLAETVERQGVVLAPVRQLLAADALQQTTFDTVVLAVGVGQPQWCEFLAARLASRSLVLLTCDLPSSLALGPGMPPLLQPRLAEPLFGKP